MSLTSIKRGVYGGLAGGVEEDNSMHTTTFQVYPSLLMTAELAVARLIATLAGPVLFIAGLGMTMSIVFVPLGIPLLAMGTLLLVWGLFGHVA